MHRQGWDLPALVAASAARDERAWDELVFRFAGLVLYVVRSYQLSAEDEQDVSRLVWLRLVEHLDQVHDAAGLPDWLAETARQECEKVLQVRSYDLYPLSEDAVRRSRLLVAIGKLSPPDRQLLTMLTASPPPSDTSISVAMGMPVDEVAPARARVLAAVRSHLTATAA